MTPLRIGPEFDHWVGQTLTSTAFYTALNIDPPLAPGEEITISHRTTTRGEFAKEQKQAQRAAKARRRRGAEPEPARGRRRRRRAR